MLLYSNYIKQPPKEIIKQKVENYLWFNSNNKRLGINWFARKVKLSTICNYIRYIYYIISKGEEINDTIYKLILYIINDSKEIVSKLRVIKDSFDKDMWVHKYNVTKKNNFFSLKNSNKFTKSKDFGEEQHQLALLLLNTEDSVVIYNKIRKLYNGINSPEAKKLIEVVIWMRYRLDIQTITREEEGNNMALIIA